MQSLPDELAEQVWEDTHQRALQFASTLLSTKYDVNVSRGKDTEAVYAPPLEKQQDLGGEGLVLSLSDFYTSEGALVVTPASPGRKSQAEHEQSSFKRSLSFEAFRLSSSSSSSSSAARTSPTFTFPDSLTTDPENVSENPRPFSRQDLLRVQTPLAAAEFSNAHFDPGELSQRSIDSLDSYASGYASLLTTSSAHTQSSHSVMPFPFHAPPGIPHVDTHIPYPSIRYGEIKQGARARNKSTKQDARKQQRSEQNERGTGTNDDDSLASAASVSQQSSIYSAGNDRGEQLSTTRQSSKKKKKKNVGGDSVDSQLSAVMEYFHAFSVALKAPHVHVTSSSNRSSSNSYKILPTATPSLSSSSSSSSSQQVEHHHENHYEISLADFEAAIRRHERAIATSDDAKMGRDLLLSLEWLLSVANLTPEQWFQHLDIEHRHAHGKISYSLLERGIFALCDQAHLPHWRKSDVAFLLRQSNPSGDGSLSLADLKFAFAQLRMPLQQLTTIREAGPVLARIYRYMKASHLRARDVFAAVDQDHSLGISRQELWNALHGILTQPPSKMVLDATSRRESEDEEEEGSRTHEASQNQSQSQTKYSSSSSSKFKLKSKPGLHQPSSLPGNPGEALGTSAYTRRALTMPDTEDAFRSHRSVMNLDEMAQLRCKTSSTGINPISRGPSSIRKAAIMISPVKNRMAYWDKLLQRQMRRLFPLPEMEVDTEH